MQTALGLREKVSVFGSDYDTPDGTCIRDYIHVTDLAQAHVLGAEYILENNASVRANLGSGTGFSVKEVIEAALELADVPFEYAPRRAGDPAKLIAKTDRAKELLGWKPKLDLRAILESDYDFRKQLLEKKGRL
jgi:UDP-glucose 4-epimerase